jgi:hypothetical protein
MFTIHVVMVFIVDISTNQIIYHVCLNVLLPYFTLHKFLCGKPEYINCCPKLCVGFFKYFFKGYKNYTHEEAGIFVLF